MTKIFSTDSRKSITIDYLLQIPGQCKICENTLVIPKMFLAHRMICSSLAPGIENDRSLIIHTFFITKLVSLQNNTKLSAKSSTNKLFKIYLIIKALFVALRVKSVITYTFESTNTIRYLRFHYSDSNILNLCAIVNGCTLYKLSV